MKDIVLDCSVVIAWFFKDEADSYSNDILESLANRQAWVPHLWTFEIANAFMVAENRKRIDSATIAQAISKLKLLPIKFDREDHDIEKLINFSKKYNLSSYDAAYLELAVRKNLPLASKDTKLLLAAKKCGVHAVM